MVPKRKKAQFPDYLGKMREKNWLGSKDSNLDCMIQSQALRSQTTPLWMHEYRQEIGQTLAQNSLI